MAIPGPFHPSCPICDAPMLEITTYDDLAKNQRTYIYGMHETGCTFPSKPINTKTTFSFKQGVAYERDGDSWKEVG